MALSFGRKKGEATNEAEKPTSKGPNGVPAAVPGSSSRAGEAGAAGAEDAIDESWFDTLAEEAAANPMRPSPVAVKSDFSVPASVSQSDFSVFSTEEPEDFGDFGTQVDIPDHSDAFVDPALMGTPTAGSSTPFDMPVTASAATPPAKKGGGLKKVLPVLLVLIIVGGGGAFWMSQQKSGEENSVGGTAMSQPTGAAPTGAAPTGAAPTGAAPTQPDPAVKAQLKKLWDEGLALRKGKKNAAAKAKWGAAVRLARSKPGYEKSADLIQQAIDKLK